MKIHLFTLLILVGLLFHEIQGQTLDDLLLAGQCEAFDDQPKMCQGIMVGGWVEVWTAPAYGLTQEYFQAQMNQPFIEGISAADAVTLLPPECAFQYAKLVCPAFLRPCSPLNSSLVPYPAMPHPVCRSVCEEFNAVCSQQLQQYGIPSLNCSRVDPLTGGPLFPPDFTSPLEEPASCTRQENDALGTVTFNCPPPLQFRDQPDELFGISCQYSCPDLSTAGFGDAQDAPHEMFITYSVLSWISFVMVLITMAVFMYLPRYRKFPASVILCMGYGLFWMHLGAIGDSFYDFTDLKCASHWRFEYGSWCKFSAWAMLYGSMTTACWWIVQCFIIWWNVALLRFKDKTLDRLAPHFYAFCFIYPLFPAFIISFVPDETATGGSYSGLPYCAFAHSVKGLSWGLYTGVLILYLLLAILFMVHTILRILLTPYAEDNWLKAFGRRLPHQLIILTFCLVYVNVVVSLIALISWAQAQESNILNSGLEQIICYLTTVGPQQDCKLSHEYNTSIMWYQTISVSTVGLFYAIIFLFMRSETRKELSQSMRSSRASSGRTSSANQSSHAASDGK